MFFLVESKSFLHHGADGRFAPGKLSANRPGLEVRDQPLKEFGRTLSKAQGERDGRLLDGSSNLASLGVLALRRSHRTDRCLPGSSLQDLGEESVPPRANNVETEILHSSQLWWAWKERKCRRS